MAGIYIHIPFCRKACHYCDFHFSTSLKTKESVLTAIQEELLLRKEELEGMIIDTIYFGGGTPSILTSDELAQIMETIHSLYPVSSSPEVTLEANPEDISGAVARDWYKLGINRLSIGIQSVSDSILTWMNRGHSAEQATNSVKISQDSGITNISVDMIYGVPHRNKEMWIEELGEIWKLNTTHLSAYCLTIEPRTVFGHRALKGEQLSSPPANSSEEFLSLITASKESGYQLYEVSNFSKPGYESGHNSSYWSGASYLGIGPGAHSYHNHYRSWNISNNHLYSKGILAGNPMVEGELLSPSDRYNEYIMTGLRRADGIDISLVQSLYQVDLKSSFHDTLEAYSLSKDLIIDQNRVYLTFKGLLLADRIASELFLTND